MNKFFVCFILLFCSSAFADNVIIIGSAVIPRDSIDYAFIQDSGSECNIVAFGNALVRSDHAVPTTDSVRACISIKKPFSTRGSLIDYGLYPSIDSARLALSKIL